MNYRVRKSMLDQSYALQLDEQGTTFVEAKDQILSRIDGELRDIQTDRRKWAEMTEKAYLEGHA